VKDEEGIGEGGSRWFMFGFKVLVGIYSGVTASGVALWDVCLRVSVGEDLGRVGQRVGGRAGARGASFQAMRTPSRGLGFFSRLEASLLPKELWVHQKSSQLHLQVIE
jgi:hypothetical protein